MNPVELYGYLVQGRQKLLGWVSEIPAEQYTQEFPFGVKTIRATLVHVADSEWIYGKRLRGEPFNPNKRGERAFTKELQPDFTSLETAWKELEAQTRQTLGSGQDWARAIEYRVHSPLGKPVRIISSAVKLAAQFLFHEVHHRAQVMAMLRQLGVAAQNLDFSTFANQRIEEE